MKKINYLFIVFAIFFANLIILLSLQSANKHRLVNHEKLVAGKFYIAKEILPDHSLYPFLMIIDRLRLESADNDKRLELLVSNAERRLFYTKKLLQKNDRDLAFTTFSKAIKYLNQALEENIVLLEHASLNKKQRYQLSVGAIVTASTKQLSFYTQNQDQFSNEAKSFLDELFAQNEVLQKKLLSMMNQSLQN